MSFITNEKQQGSCETSGYGQTNIFNPQSFLNLRHQSVDGQGDDQEKVQTEEDYRVTKGIAYVSNYFT